MITEMKTSYRVVSDARLAELRGREDRLFHERTPASRKTFERAHEMLLNGVPMPWMGDWGTSHPIFVKQAQGNRISDIDGNEYLDFCLGDTGAMFGHSPEPTAAAVADQVRNGITTMLPSESALAIGSELGRRFGLPFWQVAMTATEANRYVLRICRALTGRHKVLVMNECYHGSIDETLPHIGPTGKLELRSDFDMNPGVPKDALTRVVEFNDIAALERELAHGDVACVLAEPIMTNCGMVLPAEGYHDALRALCTRYGSILVIDETHTLSTGPGGYTAAYGLKPDFVTLGKSIAGGIPVAVYGFTKEIADRINASFGKKSVSDPMGIGGTLSGNMFAIRAMEATLTHVATDDAFGRMIAGQNRLSDGLDAALKRHDIPWSVTRSGARCELQFMPRLPKNGSEAKAHFDWELIYYTHLYLANRGVLITPFHNMMLVPPMATDAQIDTLVQVWGDCMAELSAR
ncbi:aspartate aminotransferase family protein [Geomonas subterranea]|uniref:Aspartate aminotransferase family protein n=1 Tax=Geomonas subterranea TaxID=2847989 RepID=A0ABX8LJA0_9BACT|nr:aspartate aminotransferase family protein [Geomonas subterranea]QXE92106.1 aspartate aminotransferase family protein [Geomonas subterranea]QXM09799.1 aspartate aminotransferase family protein [Geomonas subterranea]